MSMINKSYSHQYQSTPQNKQSTHQEHFKCFTSRLKMAQISQGGYNIWGYPQNHHESRFSQTPRLYRGSSPVSESGPILSSNILLTSRSTWDIPGQDITVAHIIPGCWRKHIPALEGSLYLEVGNKTQHIISIGFNKICRLWHIIADFGRQVFAGFMK